MRSFVLPAGTILILALLASCASGGADLVTPSSVGVEPGINAYVDNFQKYEIHYFSHVGPTAIVFDPKGDGFDVALRGKWWKPVPDREALEDLVRIMQNGYGMGEFVRVIVPAEGGGAAGVLYTPGIARVGAKEQDPKTVVVQPVWKEMACVGETRARILGEGLCYTIENDGDDMIFPSFRR